MGRIVIFGATSGIARAFARERAARGDALVLVGRDLEALRREADDLATRHRVACETFAWDLLDKASHAERFAALAATGDLGGVFFAPGVMPPEADSVRDPAVTRLVFDLNLTEPVVVLNLFAAYFLKRERGERGRGFISVLSSVAGDRGRAGLRTYGASKAGLSAWLEGLRGSLHGTGVLVQTVKPGPTRTPMTADYKGAAALVSEPEVVARCISRGLDKGATTVYAPARWALIMAVIRALPEFLARKVPG